MTFVSRFNSDDFELLVQIVDESNNPVDLSGDVLIQFGMATSENSTELLVSKSYPASGITISSALEGLVLIDVNDTDTAGMNGDYYFEVRLTIDEDSAVVVNGTIRLKPSIF